jgi:hypothetical protein
MVDKKAIKILFKRYWSSAGWTDTFISRNELNYAKDAGVMFEQIELSHDEIIQRLILIVNKLSLKEVTDQFIASLSTRRLDLRSALGSYMVGRHIVHHVFAGDESYCTYCGAFSKDREKQDLNVLNFERFKWGGVRHLDPLYILFDLEQFDKTEKLVPLTMDYEIINEMIRTIIGIPPEAKIRDLEKVLSKVIKSNKEEREVLLQILGFCSILAPNKYPGFTNRFIPFEERELPDHSKNDWSYPVCWWNGKEKVNVNALKEVFRMNLP